VSVLTTAAKVSTGFGVSFEAGTAHAASDRRNIAQASFKDIVRLFYNRLKGIPSRLENVIARSYLCDEALTASDDMLAARFHKRTPISHPTYFFDRCHATQSPCSLIGPAWQWVARN
jgi:hypothetical protein